MGILAPAADERIVEVGFAGELLSVQLKDGRIVGVPLKWYPRLLNATPRQRANWRISADGYSIHWPEVDEDLDIEGILLGIPAAKGTLPVPRERVESDAIASVGYDRDRGWLEIEFKEGGEVYRYFGVPEEEYQALIGADSRGKHLNQQFKERRYRYARIR
jgi:hypothetical protein